jgi:hypothetical protein
MQRNLLIASLLLLAVIAAFAGAFFFHIGLTPQKEAAVLDRLTAAVGDIPPYGWLLEGVASAAGVPRLEVNYDPSQGRGYAVQRREDGTGLMVSFSLYDGREEGILQRGPVIGGRPEEFPKETNGVAFFDGSSWQHLWCNSNEGIAESRSDNVLEPHRWQYLGGEMKRTLLSTIITGRYRAQVGGQAIAIEKVVELHADKDYFTVKTTLTNEGHEAVFVDYAFGDEPWVGRFGSSEGDIGWFREGYIRAETYLDPSMNSYAGFWDRGNDAVDERGNFSGLANFIEWSPEPTMVYFSNDFHSVQTGKPLVSDTDRVMNIVWKGQLLAPGKPKTYVFKIGKARQDNLTGLPSKPSA